MIDSDLDKEKGSATRQFHAEFPANSLRIPWGSSETRCLCGFQTGIFFYGKKFPAKFPAQGIWPDRASVRRRLFKDANVGW